MKNTARRILAALLMSSLILSSGISAIAATGAPAAASPAPAAAISNLPLEGKVSAKLTDEVSSESTAPAAATTAPAATTSNLPLAEKAVNNHSLPLQGEVAPKAPEGVSSNEASNEVSSNEASAPAAVESPIVLGETRATVNEAPVEVVTIEENATPLAPKADSTTPNLPLEGKVSAELTDEVSPDEVSSNEESSNDLSPALTLTSTTYSGVTVEVNADEGVLPSDASLFVAEIKSRAGKQTAEDALGNTNIEYDDYMVLDIQIRDGQANEIEPDGNVRVNIMMDASKLPEDADESTLEIQHLAEDADGAVKAVETVADNGNMTNGSIGVNGDNVEAEFTVGSFSLFTISWRRYHDEAITETKLVFEAYLLDDALTAFNKEGQYDIPSVPYKAWDIEGDYHFTLNKNENSILISKIMDDNSVPSTIEMNGKTYSFYSAVYDGTAFDALRHDPWNPQGASVWIPKDNAFGNGAIHLINAGTDTGKYIPFGKGDQTIRLEYRSGDFGKLHPVDSLEVTKDGDPVSSVIDMYLFKYKNKDLTDKYIKGTYNKGRQDHEVRPASDVQSYGGIKHYRGQITQGLVQKLIPDGQEYPDMYLYKNGSLTGETMSGKEWFSKDGTGSQQGPQEVKHGNTYSGIYGKAAQKVDGLFVKEIYDKYGYFYYGSDEYGVELEDNTFDLYNEVVTSVPSAYVHKQFFWRRGNFLPYNTINPNIVAALTETDMAGNTLDPSDKLYHKPVYEVNEPAVGGTGAGNDVGAIHNFGMSVEASFFQPVDGLQKNPATGNMDPMVFRFNGDDDFWLYIDDVLVLDLGGSHDAQEGYIDFREGMVYWTDNGTGDQSVRSRRFVDYDGIEKTMKYDGSASLYDQFVAAYGSEEAVDGLGIFTKEDGPFRPFKDGTSHTMKIYYMEHGGGASNLRMMFNIPVQPVNDLTVSKTFLENGRPKEVPDDFVATFEVYEVDAQGKLLKDSNGEVLPAVGTVRLDKGTAASGIFERIVENGQARYEYKFRNLPVSHKYIVVEKIYRSDIGYVNTTWTNRDLNALGEEEERYLAELPDTNATLIADLENKTPTFIKVSDIFEVEAKSDNLVPLLDVQNHYQMTLTVEKHVHSENKEDLTDTLFEYRLYLKNADGSDYTEPVDYIEILDINNTESWKLIGLDDPTALWEAKKGSLEYKNGYYTFWLKHNEAKIFLIPSGLQYEVAENVGGAFRVFRPFTNLQIVKRDETKTTREVVRESNGDVVWGEKTKLIPEDGVEGYKKTPAQTLLDDAKVTFINERQIVRTGVVLNSAPTMMMLAVVFFAAAGICVKYLRKKADEEAEEHGDLFD